MSKHKNKFNQGQLISALFAMIVFSIAGYFLWKFHDDFVEILGRFSGFDVLLISATVLIQWWIRSWRDQMLFASQNHTISMGTLYYLNGLQLLLNHLPFKAGTVVAVAWLKKNRGVSYAAIAMNMVLQNITMLGAASLCAAVALLLRKGCCDARGGMLAGFLFLIFLACVVFVAALPYIPKLLPRRFSTKIIEIEKASQFLKTHPKVFIWSFCLSALMYVLSAFRLFWICRAAGFVAEWSVSLVYGTMGYLSTILSITPAALGIRELMLGAASGALSLNFREGVFSASIERVFTLALVVVTVFFYWCISGRHPKRIQTK